MPRDSNKVSSALLKQIFGRLDDALSENYFVGFGRRKYARVVGDKVDQILLFPKTWNRSRDQFDLIPNFAIGFKSILRLLSQCREVYNPVSSEPRYPIFLVEHFAFALPRYRQFHWEIWPSTRPDEIVREILDHLHANIFPLFERAATVEDVLRIWEPRIRDGQSSGIWIERLAAAHCVLGQFDEAKRIARSEIDERRRDYDEKRFSAYLTAIQKMQQLLICIDKWESQGASQ